MSHFLLQLKLIKYLLWFSGLLVSDSTLSLFSMCPCPFSLFFIILIIIPRKLLMISRVPFLAQYCHSAKSPSMISSVHMISTFPGCWWLLNLNLLFQIFSLRLKSMITQYSIETSKTVCPKLKSFFLPKPILLLIFSNLMELPSIHWPKTKSKSDSSFYLVCKVYPAFTA